MISPDEIARRKPVWVALSNLWLDTELTHEDLVAIAEVMKQSGYSIKQLREIYLFEIAPVVYLNTWSVAGVWEGFDPDWICETCTKRTGRKQRWLRFWVKMGFQKWTMTYATEGHWDVLVNLSEDLEKE